MTSITQTIQINPDHKLHLDLQLPDELPSGQARVVITILPEARATQSITTEQIKASLPPELAGSLEDTSAITGSLPGKLPESPNRLSAVFGRGKGQVRMSDDFDAPLDEFGEYL